jgi:hypothetical protein
MWKSKGTPGFITIVSLITLVGITIGNILPVDYIKAQPIDPTQPNSGNGNAQANNFQNSDFVMQGTMSSYIGTNASDFVVSGNWTLKTEGGNLSDFNAEMIWSPTNVTAPNIRSHGHSFSNFIPDSTNEKIALMGVDNTLGPKQTVSINGVMDVGAGDEKTKWPGVPAKIKLAGNTITISLDDSKTGGHFNNYPVFGEIQNTKPCNGPTKQQFGANMEVMDIPTCTEGGSGNAPTQQDTFADAPTQQDTFADAPTQ